MGIMEAVITLCFLAGLSAVLSAVDARRRDWQSAVLFSSTAMALLSIAMAGIAACVYIHSLPMD